MTRRFPASLRAPLGSALLFAALTAQPLWSQALSAPSKNAQAAAPQSPFHGDVVEDIVARVNDQIISTSDYQRAESELDQATKQRNLSPTDVAEQKRQLLRDLIDNQLLLSKGKQLGITGEAETVRQLDELRKQNNLDSMEALEKAAQQQGVSFADFKASIQNRIITSQVVRDEVGRRINITHTDEEKYYEDHKDQFTTPEQVRLSEILIPTPDPDNAQQVADAQKKADDVYAQLKGGKNFAELAKAGSGGTTAAQGGTLGDFKRGQLAPVLEEATFPLAKGQYTAPIRTKQGFIVLEVDDHIAAGLQPFAQVQGQVEDAVGGEKIQPALRAYLTRLREEAFIDIKPGYTDSAASTNETRPIFSAYLPPQPKKKKGPVRARYGVRGRTREAAPSLAKAAQAAPAGVPSLAQVPGGGAADAAGAPAAGQPTVAANTTATPPETGKNNKQIAAVQKPGKREKVRFGQAPRQSLPEAPTRGQDAGASTAGGNSSDVETASSEQTQSSVAGGVNKDIHFSSGESAGDVQTQEAAGKTRFSDRAKVPKAVKAERVRKSKQDPFPAPAPDSQELADKSTQARPLGLEGDTSKPAPKPRPTGKTRYSEEGGKKDAPPAPGTEVAPGTTVGAPGTAGDVTNNPGGASPQEDPVTRAPIPTSATPNGTGDPLGPPTPPAAPPGAPQQR